MIVRGSVDLMTSTEVTGWVYAPGRSDPVLVQAVLNHEILGETVADIFRSDLAAAGLGNGRSGYVIKLFRPVDPLYFPFIVVKVDGGDAELPRAQTLGFGEFFRALHAAHPSAGRSRSVFGGLWTDRTDAAALLQGKSAIGQIDAAAAAAVERLIQHGYAIVELREPPRDEGWHAALAERLADVMEDNALLPVLRAVLEDNPMAVAADLVDDGATRLAQPSAENPSPSPAECVAVAMPVGETATLEIVRDSHRLTEFTPDGASRWASRDPADGMRVVGANGLLARVKLPVGAAAVVGAGTLYRLRCEPGAAVLKGLCVPER